MLYSSEYRGLCRIKSIEGLKGLQRHFKVELKHIKASSSKLKLGRFVRKKSLENGCFSFLELAFSLENELHFFQRERKKHGCKQKKCIYVHFY